MADGTARPFGTHYYHGVRDKLSEFVSGGATVSEVNAVRAAVGRIFLGQYEKAIIYDRHTGVSLYGIRKTKGGIEISYGSGVDFKAEVQELALAA